MTTWRPDPTFYPSARLAMAAPPEELAYVVRVNPNDDGRPDGIVVIDTSPTSSTYGTVVGEVEMAYAGDELHHFSWNACSSMLCPSAAPPHVERRYLIVPALGILQSCIAPRPSHPAAHRQNDRSGGTGRAFWLCEGAHRPLRNGWHLH